jgi:lysophospholipase L1-like esterase
LKLSNVDVVSFSGYRIEQMWGVIGHKVTNYSVIVLHIGANNLWNDTPSEVLNHYQQLVHKVLQVNSRCQVLLSGLLPRAQDFYPGKMKSEDFLYLVNRKAAFINNKLSIIVQSNSRLSYIGHTSFVIGGKLQQRQLLSKDGLHFSRSGAATVVRDLEGEIQHLLKRYPFRSLRTTTQ